MILQITTGPDRNRIQGVLRDVPWKMLNQNNAVHEACKNEGSDRAECHIREIINWSQSSESCQDTVKKIITALEKLATPYVKQASELWGMFGEGEHVLIDCIIPLQWHLCTDKISM